MAGHQATETMPGAALWEGHVIHRRLQPFRHDFKYRVFTLSVDLDRLAELDRTHRHFGFNRNALISFHECDHGPRDGSPLKPWAVERLAGHGIDIAGGQVEIVSFPRIMGYVFNPISLWYCRDAGGTLRAVIHEVKNTFGEQHCYIQPVSNAQSNAGILTHACDKLFHVSPFIDMAASYHFRIAPPGERLSVFIRETNENGTLLLASLTGRRRAFSDAGIRAMLWRHPLLTLKVTAAIHWQALKLFGKGARYHRRPQQAQPDVTALETARW